MLIDELIDTTLLKRKRKKNLRKPAYVHEEQDKEKTDEKLRVSQ